MTKKILIPIPDRDFDPTEASIPWKYLMKRGYEVVFSTENGNIGEADPVMLRGVLFGLLRTKPDARKAYDEMKKHDAFQNPISYSEIEPEKFDLLLLPGGHAKGMKQYLESKILQKKVLDFTQEGKLIGAICHGPLILARTVNPDTNKSILYGKKVTALPKFFEKMAYYLTFWHLGTYFRTYPTYVQDEVSRSLENNKDFLTGHRNIFKPFVVEDKRLITARWPGDIYLFVETLIKHLEKIS